jgi:hypothetical protein
MTFTAVSRLFVIAALGLAGATAMAAADMPKLAIFGNRSTGKGLWKMQVLDSSDKEMLKNAKQVAAMGFCMDAASEMAEKATSGSGAAAKDAKSKCDSKILRNTSTVAEMTVSCPDGDKSHITMTADSKDSFIIDATTTKKSGKSTMMKVRYAYAGPCKADSSVIQMDGNSEPCKKMKAQIAQMDPAVTCAKMTGNQKAACEAQMKSALAQMQKMCP